jgi:hypothetical protein
MDLWDVLLQRDVVLVVHDDNSAMIQVCRTGKNPTMRHLGRTHRVSVQWLHERFKDPCYHLVYEETNSMRADIFTKGFADQAKWSHALSLINHVDARSFWKYDPKTAASYIKFKDHDALDAGGLSPPAGAGAALAATLRGRDDLAGLLVFPDGLHGDCERFLRALHEGLPEAARAAVVGGAAGDAMELRETSQYRDDLALQGALCAVAIFGPAQIAVEVSHGCEAVGTPMRITRVEGSWLHEIDGRPALPVFEEYLAGGVEALTEEGIAHLGLGEVSPDAPDVLEVIHTPHGFDRATGSMGFPGGGLSPGPVRLVRRDADAVRSSAVSCALRLRDALGARRPAFVLQFDCAGRGQTLFGPETSDAIVRPLREALGGDAPWVGFPAYGEIAPVRGRARYHNYTVALCALYDA